MHRARFAESLLRAARGKRRQPARDPRLGRLEPERSPDGRALYARCRPEGALPQRRREGGGMIRASILAAALVVTAPAPRRRRRISTNSTKESARSATCLSGKTAARCSSVCAGGPQWPYSFGE